MLSSVALALLLRRQERRSEMEAFDASLSFAVTSNEHVSDISRSTKSEMTVKRGENKDENKAVNNQQKTETKQNASPPSPRLLYLSISSPSYPHPATSTNPPPSLSPK